MERAPSARLRLAVLVASVACSALLVLGLLKQRTAASRHLPWSDGSGISAREEGAEIPLDGWPPKLVREPLTPELAKQFYPWNELPHWSYEPVVGTRRRAHLDYFHHFSEHPAGGWPIRTNHLGFRNDEELAPHRPDLRILVAGDSQTESLCSNADSWAGRLAAMLSAEHPGRSVEVLNAGLSGTNPYTYLGVLERYGAELAPDVFLSVFYGGNDFRDALLLQRYFHRRPYRPWFEALKEVAQRLESLGQGLLYAEIYQAAYFAAVPEDVEIGIGLWAALALEMQQRCDELGARLVCVYLPSPYDAQPVIYAAQRALVEELLAGLEIDLDLNCRMGEAWIELMAASGVRVLDLRPALRDAGEHLFWSHDHHLNLAGQRVVAQALFAALALDE